MYIHPISYLIIYPIQDENGDLLGKLAEMSDSIRGLEETIKGLEDREEEAKARRREGESTCFSNRKGNIAGV